MTSVDFLYHFVGNNYINATSGRSEIHCHDSFGVENNIRLHVTGNVGPHRSEGQDELALVFTDTGANDPLRDGPALSQYSATPLFTPPVPVTTTTAMGAYFDVLGGAGCNIERDAIDARIVQDVVDRNPTNIVTSQEDVPGGWPSY